MDSKNNPLAEYGLNPDILLSSQLFVNSKGDKRTIDALIVDRSNFEDDGIRSLNYFYDPVYERAPLPFSDMSPDWMLEDQFDVDLQEYSWKDTNEAFYRALTLPTEAERNAELGKVFESLGRSMHHIQDMAQPQHVRNDLHCDDQQLCKTIDAVLLLGAFDIYNPSAYEEYSFDEISKDNISTKFTLDYPIPVFDSAREYWTTKAVDSDIVDRRGMADFTNRNFVSMGTNFTVKVGTPVTNSDYDLLR